MPADPRQRVAQLLEDQAIELEGASHRLRALGMAIPAERVNKIARSLAAVTRSVGGPSEALNLFFSLESASDDDELAEDTVSDVPTHRTHRVPAVPESVPMQRTEELVSLRSQLQAMGLMPVRN